MYKRNLVTAFAMFFCMVTLMPAQTTLLPKGSVWHYHAADSLPASNWNTTAYNSSSWSSGPAELGYGDGDEATVIPSGPTGEHYWTSYYRTTFDYTPGSYDSVRISLKRDDGAVVYFNGTELYRSNMADGDVYYDTPAASRQDGEAEKLFYDSVYSLSVLQSGTNLVAVEIHQYNQASSDVSFNMEIVAFGPTSIKKDNCISEGPLFGNVLFNPFNPAITIIFSIPIAGHTALALYNAEGKIVAEPVKGFLNSGRQQVHFNCAYLNSGIYFYKLAAREKIMAGKMVLIKK